MEGSGFPRLESIHEWCDFEETMIFKQDRSRSCSWRIRIGLGRQARRFKSHTQDAAALNEHRHSSKYQECDKKTSQLTGFFYLCWTFLKLFCIVTNCIPCRLGTNINMKLYSYLRVIIQAVNWYWKWIILWTNFPQRSSAILAKSSCICKRRLWLISLNKFPPLQQSKRILINKGQGTRSGLPTPRTVAHAHHAWGWCQFKLYRTTAATAFDHEVSFLKVDTVFLHSTSGQTR